jgi:hypothetical protein
VCTRLAAASDKVYQLLAHGRWFSLGTPASFTTKPGGHDIAEILLKVALSTINQIIKSNHKVTCEKSLKIPKWQSEFVYRRRTDITMAKRKSTKGQTTINKTYI